MKNFPIKLWQRLVRFFTLRGLKTFKSWLWFCLSRFVVSVTLFYVSLTLIFTTLPVPFSAYMAQQKAAHLISGKPYSVKYDWVSLDEIAWQMQMAVIASEDQKFESHFGIDLLAIENVLKRYRHSSKKSPGASTISQQTVKNLYLWHGQSWLRKGIELPLTLLIEGVWSKSRILEVYLNIAEFGEGIFGVEAAAQHYFHKAASALTLSESALLAAALPNPHIYKVKHPGSVMKKRQQWIIRQVDNLGGKHYLEKF